MALLLDRWSADQASGAVAADLAAAIARIEAVQQHKLPPGCFDIATARAWLNEFAALIGEGSKPRAIPTSSRVYASPIGPVAARIYTPRTYSSVIVFAHGGGWVIGGTETHDHICRWLSGATGSRVVSVEYGLAPESPFPAAVVQTNAVLAAVLEETEVGGKSVFVAGDSAGANIGAMAVLAGGADLASRTAGFISIYGAYCPEMNLSSHKLYGDGRFGLSQAQMRWFWNLYAPHIPSGERDRLTPLAADLSFFPPTLCIGAECDLLLDDTIAFYSSLTRAGIDVSLSLWPGIVHGAMHFVQVVDSVTAAAGVIIRYVEEHGPRVGSAVAGPPESLAQVLRSPSCGPLSTTVVAHLDNATCARFDGVPAKPIESSFLTSRSRLHGSIAHRLGIEIIGGTRQEGSLLPNEDRVSASYGVSRSAYREAIRTLAAKGLVTATPKIGTKIAARAAWRLLDPDVITWHFEANCTSSFIRDLFEMRKVVEPSAAALAAMRRDEEAVSKLADALARMARHNAQDQAWQNAVLDFHHLVLGWSKNELLTAMWPPVEVTLCWSLNLQTCQSNPCLVSDPVADHAKVFQKVASQDPEGALREMAFLIDAALADTMAILGRAAVESPREALPRKL